MRVDRIESEFFGHDWISYNMRNAVDMNKHVLFGAIVPGNGLVELQWEKWHALDWLFGTAIS